MRTLNLGILAHFDAGKTSLTERLLFDAGVIQKLGSVDSGNTHTDNLDLERQRGITIQAAVVSFVMDDTRVNLIDKPGHPDFIAEVERILGLLDVAVVVISAVEGVQSQTRVLVRVLRRLGVPFIFFINKVDRRGADFHGVFDTLAVELSVRPIAMSAVKDAGTRQAQAEALSSAQTIVCEPVDRFRLEVPATSLNTVLTLLTRAGAAARDTAIINGIARLEGSIASAKVQTIQQQLSGATSGMGTMETAFDHYTPVLSHQPTRQRSGANPFHTVEYLSSRRRSHA